MVGEKFSHQEVYQKRGLGENVLELNGLSGHGFSNVNLTVKKGSNRSDRTAGIRKQRTASGTFRSSNGDRWNFESFWKECRIHSIQGAMKAGIAMLALNRKENSVIPDMSILVNISFRTGSVCPTTTNLCRKRKRALWEIQKAASIKAADSKDPITSLSGGNQQKVFLARWLNTEAGILLLDNPTQGIDVGAKAEIYKLILKLADAGKTILINTLEIPELAKGRIKLCCILWRDDYKDVAARRNSDEKTVMLYSTNAAQKGES